MRSFVAAVFVIVGLLHTCPALAADKFSLPTEAQIRRLSLEGQEQYFTDLQNFLVTIEDFENGGEAPAKTTRFLFSLLLAPVLAEDFSDVRKVGLACMYAGNISKYQQGAKASRPTCAPTHEITIAGQTYRCANAKDVVCNPLAFGFMLDKSEGLGTGGIRYDHSIKKRDPICVPAGVHATRDCRKKGEDTGSTKYAASMLTDLKLWKPYSDFGPQFKEFCQFGGGHRNTLNKTECTKVGEGMESISQAQAEANRATGGSTNPNGQH